MKRAVLIPLSLAEEMNARTPRYFTETKLRAQNLSLSRPAFCFSPSKKMREFFADKKTISASVLRFFGVIAYKRWTNVNVHARPPCPTLYQFFRIQFFRVLLIFSILPLFIFHRPRKLSSNEFCNRSHRSSYQRFSLLKISLS